MHVASVQQARVLVNNALKLYSQDKTGMVDFALESGGEYTEHGGHLLAGLRTRPLLPAPTLCGPEPARTR